ncbi:MAG: vWA domain-containing protein, partial [Deferrisomatales bacterium]
MVFPRSRWRITALAAALAAGLAVAGCGEDDLGASPGTTPGPAGPVAVELSGTPTVSYDPARGRTAVVVQFVARGADGVPLSPDDVTVEMLVDGRALDNESVLQASAQELTASLHYGLVLDASGSMLQHVPPAFGPMKTAARRSVEEGAALWQNRPGVFSWDAAWFNDVLFHRQGAWQPADLDAIPAPDVNAATKLYAAVQFAAETMRASYLAGTANGPRDHHVLVVFSDGADNLSNFDNSASVVPSVPTTATGKSFERFGWRATTLEDAVAAIQAHPRLTVHVLAMGAQLNPGDYDKLKQLSQAAGGQFLANSESGGTTQLFERVTKEFTTLQTRGASIPQQAGDHTFKLVVKGKTFTGE